MVAAGLVEDPSWGQEGSGGSTPVPVLGQSAPAHPKPAPANGFGSLVLSQKGVIKEEIKALSSTSIHCSGAISSPRQLLSSSHLASVC